jgi:predicted DNA-binding transcriptional regulator AlpA
MAVTFITSTSKPKKPKCNGHTKAVAPIIPLDQPGRLRVSHLMSILGISHSTLYHGIKMGRYPKRDGLDGKMPFWNTETIRNFLKAKSLN